MPDRAQEPAELTPVFYDWSLAFEHEATRKGLAYWNEQRGAQSVPAFKDIRPKGMKDFIANVSLIERGIRADGAAEYSVRLTGERVRERYGAVARHKLQESLPAEMERRWRHALELVRTAQVPVRVTDGCLMPTALGSIRKRCWRRCAMPRIRFRCFCWSRPGGRQRSRTADLVERGQVRSQPDLEALPL